MYTYTYYELADGFQLETTASGQRHGFFYKSKGWTRELMDELVLTLGRTL